MRKFFRQLPLPLKLLLVGLVPLLFLIYLSMQLYIEKTQKVNLLGSYIASIDQSASITRLIDELQKERRFSYEFALKKDWKAEMLQQRPVTDSVIQFLEKKHDETLADFQKYTFLQDLKNMRLQLDSNRFPANQVMHSYTNMIFRLNTLNGIPPVSNIYLRNVYRDLGAQKTLSEMVTYLGIMSSNVYNVLYTKQYMIETLIGTMGVYQVYNSYEREFMVKANEEQKKLYQQLRNHTDLKPTMAYLDSLFKKFTFDSTYNYKTWGAVSFNAIEQLRNFQESILQKAETSTNEVYQEELQGKNNTLIYLIISLVIVIAIVAYTVYVINKMLNELKIAALKIADGATGLKLKAESNDAIGSLAKSISKIDENNIALAEAATAIGRGKFDVPVKPRSDKDLLGNALMQMESNLQRLMQENEASKDEFKQLADFMPQIVWTAGTDGVPVFLNKRWFEYTGLKAGHDQEARRNLVHPDDRNLSIDLWKSSLESGKPFNFEYRIRSSETGEYRWFLARAVPIRDKDGKIAKWFGTFTDIHERKKISEQLEELVKERTNELERSNDDLRQFAHIASHDLKEPLRKIQVFSSRLLYENRNLSGGGKIYLEKMENAAGRMSKMIEGILNYSVISDKTQIFEQVDLNKLIQGITEDLEIPIKQKNATVNYKNLPEINGIPVLMHQLFYNLVSNALKFSRDGVPPLVEISSRELANATNIIKGEKALKYVEIEVRDNGIGFQSDESEKIFDIFTRLNSREKFEGTGLGLALCKKIVHRHHGEIYAKGQEGVGASFFVVLPLD
ncbi:MAG TPA: ATP-binding protein [Chitinophagaceae bacterium]|nr:ATP-binding protein [Chitinophagaceae bacterium]